MKNIEKVINEGKEAATIRYRLDLLASEMIEIAAKSPDKYDAIQNAYWAGLAIGLRNRGNHEKY